MYARPVLSRIDRYILKKVMMPMLTTLGVAALLLILERMLKLFDFVVNQGGPVEVVFRMLANLTPHYMGLALPVGLLLGVLVAFRNISLSSEYDAITSSGTSLMQLVRPLLMLALLLATINTILVGWVQPYSQYAYRGLVFDLRSGALGASIRVGDFVEIGDDITLMIEESRQQGAELGGIFLERRSEGNSISVTAERGGFFATGDDQTILLRLFNGVLVDLNESQNKPRVLTFERQDLTIRLPEREVFRERGGQELELTLPELFVEKDNPENSIEERAAFTGNFHWRIMHSLSFFILPFLAIPMGLTNKRTGRSTGIVIGLALLIVYNELMEGMETAVKGGVSPYLSIWALFAAFAFISFFLFRVAAFKAGGEPLAYVDAVVSTVAGPIKRLGKRIAGIGDRA
ncbi:LPS export ABC transporter permease LptF [Kordiimonas aquimaris]|uniref:LPS export ABC transporter permease LptF n=1 Tax=Kordiimonas aquimaris TaxID=707591 RepID=UPI0021D24959|nr:LPS export ABC transporter permease LptF [Kordiimonas aquimaris]